MKKLFIFLLIGIAAGVIDVTPMIFMDLNWQANTSAFVHWIVLAIIIPYVRWDIKSWSKGSIIAVMTAIPIILITTENDYSSIIAILVFSVILGAIVGWSGEKIMKKY